MKRILLLFVIAGIIFGAAAIFAIDGSASVSVPKPEPICRLENKRGHCLFYFYPSGTLSAGGITTIRENIYWSPARSSTKGMVPAPQGLPLW